MAVSRTSSLRDKSIVSTYRLPVSLLEGLQQDSDPRTVASYVKQAEKIATKSKKKGIRGIAARMTARISDLPTLRKKIELEAQTQPALEAIRRRREKAVEQATAGMTRTRGKASLLSSQAGGAGFFQRYFT